MANILYLGNTNPVSTSAHRANTLVRLGHHVVVSNPYGAFAKQIKSRWLGPIHFRTGYRLLSSSVTKWLAHEVQSVKPDFVWVNSGELFGPGCLKILKQLACPIILYNNDDPTGGRDGRRFDSLLKALPYYDLAVVRREINVSEYKARGVDHVIRVFMSYDEEAHKPFEKDSDIPEELRSEVAFIGTWMRYEKRDEFLLELVDAGIPVSIWGDRWQKSPHFQALKSNWRGPALAGRDYVAAMQGAKICLGLLSSGNRDLHTRRSVETTYAGGLLCAERTTEHQQMYKEGVEAVFWSDTKECIQACKQLLENDEEREKIRLAGMKRVRSLKLGNEDVCSYIIKSIEKIA